MLVNYWFCTGGLFLPSFTLTAMGTPLLSLHHPYSIRHRNLNLNKLHCLMQRKIQTIADLENISDVFINCDLDFQNMWTSHENSMVVEQSFKILPPLKSSLFSFKTKFTQNSSYDNVLVPSRRVFGSGIRLGTSFWGKHENLYQAYCVILGSTQKWESLQLSVLSLNRVSTCLARLYYVPNTLLAWS